MTGTTTANEVFDGLVAGIDFTLPDVDLSDPSYDLPPVGDLGAAITRMANSDLTEKKINGDGTFDVLMSALQIHLQKEYEANRITGEQYSKTYIALTTGAMTQAVQFLLAKDSSYWQAIVAQQQAMAAQAGVITARVQLAIAKVQLQSARAEAVKNQAEFALMKMKLATEDITYDIADYNLNTMMPAQLQMVNEQKEAARAQTMDTRSDGITQVVGILGRQADLYEQQVTSYKRDSEMKAARVFIDAWMTMKTIDEGLLPPTSFDNTNLQEILSTLKTVNNLGV
jgi:hypothetical protein